MERLALDKICNALRAKHFGAIFCKLVCRKHITWYYSKLMPFIYGYGALGAWTRLLGMRDKKIDEDGNEYWSARDLMTLIGYVEFRNFRPIIHKAIEACENSSENVNDHFVQVNDMVDIGSNSKRKIANYHLSRYACYLAIQNADPAKPMVALGQTIFCGTNPQTRN